MRRLTDEQLVRRREYTSKQKIRLDVFKQMTVMSSHSIQQPAFDDYDGLMEHYLPRSPPAAATGGGEAAVCEHGDSDSDDEQPEERMRMPAHMKSAESSVHGDLRQQFKREFVDELSLPSYTVECESDSSDLIVNANEPSQDKENVDNHLEPTNESCATANKACASPDIARQHDDRETATLCEGCEDSHLQESSPLRTIEQRFLSPLWSMEPRVFAKESSLTGKRKFICANMGRFMDHYWRNCDVHTRHYYELIKETSPCRLYFDMEFNRPANTSITDLVAEELLDQFFEELRYEFRSVYGISISRTQLVDLDSSTAKKFSRHWVLHLPCHSLFSDNREAGVFVRHLMARLEEERESGLLDAKDLHTLSTFLAVNDETSTRKTYFVDLGVYTRNRVFRLMASTKYGKRPDAGLRIAKSNEFPFPRGFDNSNFYLPSMASSSGNSNEEINDSFERFCKSLSFEDHAAALAETLIVPINATKINYPLLNNPSSIFNGVELGTLKYSSRFVGKGVSSKYQSRYGKSPFPMMEEFVVNVLGKRRGLVGSIGTWSLDSRKPLPQTIAFNMKGNRWCENVNRAHKSNNIIWNVHLVNRICWQSCHDPECKHFRGEPVELPEEIHREIDDFFIDCEIGDLDEADVLKRADKFGVGKRGVVDDEFADSSLDAALGELNLSDILPATCVGKGRVACRSESDDDLLSCLLYLNLQ